MCGFVGVLKSDFKSIVDKALLEPVAKCLAHRGPDESGFFCYGSYGSFHQRLRIIDLTSAGKQPMQNISEEISICYNGEVYNFAELRDKYSLSQKFEFRSKTDTEVLLYLYELLGISFIQELNGMFAIAIWDRRFKKIFLIRDRFGIKPLYYTILPNGDFWFSSEIKALLKIPSFERKLCIEAVHHYFSYGYIPGDITAFKSIKKIKPGNYLEINCFNTTEPQEVKYWRPIYGEVNASKDKAAIGNIRELLLESVTSQLVSDVPVGVMLSGGLDSSTIAYFASKSSANQLHTFSLGFHESTFDETRYSDLVANHLGTIHHKIKVTPTSIIKNIERAISYIDEPYADGSAIPTYLLAEVAKDYVTVLLSGEGGDEVFGGYETYLAYKAKKIYGYSNQLFDSMLKRVADALPTSHEKLSLSFKFKRFVSGVRNTVPVSHYKWREIFSESEKSLLLNSKDSLKTIYGSSSDLFASCFEGINGGDDLNKLLAIDCHYFLPDDLMVKNDRMTMAHSLEARVPFTDLALFEYLAQFSGSSKIPKMQLKYLLRQAIKPFLPESIVKKKKIGLEIPYSKWFCGELKEFLLSHLSEQSLKEIPIINGSYVRHLMTEHFSMTLDRGRELWSVLNFVIWYKMYFVDEKYRE